MPSYVNIGAWVGSGSMVDTWATVGSCAQIGRDVHLSGGVGIGGGLEPRVVVEREVLQGPGAPGKPQTTSGRSIIEVSSRRRFPRSCGIS